MAFLKIREELTTPARHISAVVAFVGLGVAWCVLTLTGLVPELILPSPISVLYSLTSMLVSGDTLLGWVEKVPALTSASLLAMLTKMSKEPPPSLIADALTSITRVVVATVLSALVAIPLGILMGMFHRIRALINPVAEPLRYLPIAAVIPLSILWFGLTEAQKISVLFIGIVVYMLPLIVAAVDRVEEVYLLTAYTLGATRWQTFCHVIWPIALPDIGHAIRVINGIGWTYVTMAEVANSESGLGHLIIQAQRWSRIDKVFVGVVVILAIGILSDRLLAWINQTLFPWKEIAK